MIQIDIGGLLALLGIPTAVTIFVSWWLQRKIIKREESRDKQEEARKKNELFLIQEVSASIKLSAAVAESMQRLDPECNGKMSSALKYAKDLLHDHEGFLQKQGVDNLL